MAKTFAPVFQKAGAEGKGRQARFRTNGAWEEGLSTPLAKGQA